MVASPKKSLALDTNLLLDLAAEEDFSHDFREQFSSRGYSLLVPPTVVAELAFFASLKHAPQRQMASVALERLSSWKCQPFPLSSTQLVIAVRFAARLIEQNDGKILAQTSLASIPLLVTSDKHLLDL